MNASTSALQFGYGRSALGQIHYAETGSGPPLLLLAESPRSWRHFRKVLPLLAPNFRVIAIDAPGYGNSHATPDPLTIEAMAQCISQFLTSMDIARTNVLGVHTGNKLAASLAAEHPEQVDRLVLAGYTHSIIPDAVARNRAIQPIFDRYAPAFGASEDGSHRVRQWLATHAYANGLWWPSTLLTARTVTEDDVQAAEAQVIDYLHGWRNVVPMYQAVFDFDLANAYRRIVAPTLVLEFRTPEESHLGGQAQAISQMMRNATPATLEVTFLQVLETDAGSVAQRILPFLLS